MGRTFDELVSEAAAAPIDGWDFAWLDGRATEERPSWGYQRLMSQRLATASAGLDIDTGGGEVLAGAAAFPPTMVATESWPPNAALATQPAAPARGRPGGDARRAAPAVRRRGVRPGDQPARDRGAVGGDLSGASPGRQLPGAADRARDDERSCSNFFSDRSRPNGLSCNQIPRPRRQRPPGCRSSRCEWNAYGQNSSISAR